MIFTYLFEAKSIQTYLFNSGKLKDVISASERLDKLVDDNEESILAKVLSNCGLVSDLLNETIEGGNEKTIHFIRCKGGAFYAYCQNKEPLTQLRSVWTMSVQQLFPNLEFTDALSESETLKDAISAGHTALAESRNAPTFKFPLATTIMDRCDRTGTPSIPLSVAANSTIHKDDKSELDVDTELHRQAYQSLNMRSTAALQDKFTPDSLKGQIAYPINLEDDFQFSAIDTLKSNSEAIKDIAIIHIDGNGLGIILRALQQALKNESEENYRRCFREFSFALSSATELAAQQATQWLYDVAKYDHKVEGDKENRTYVPMRPIVLGGDDITLLCRADLAIEYSKRFCIAFKNASQEALKNLYAQQLKDQKDIEPYLTASGGILFHKAGHPFIQSHHVVEALCAKAKKLTKKTGKNVGPAALAFYRTSNAIASDLEQLVQLTHLFEFTNDDEKKKSSINLSLSAYLVESDDTEEVSFADIDNAIAASKSSRSISMTKWRQIATSISLGDMVEAERIFKRSIDRIEKSKLTNIFSAFSKDIQQKQWYWQTAEKQFQTVISDLLTVDHFTTSANSAIKNGDES
jgi:hypothetical protein